MVLSNNKLMMIYGFDQNDRTFLDNIIEELKLPPYRVIEKNMANMTLRDIINGLKIETYNKELPEEKVIIFNNFSDDEVHTAIRAIRSNKEVKPILAVVTPTSINWEFHSLLEHLIQEREQAKRYMAKKNQ